MNKVITHVVVGVSALALGGVGGYLLGKKKANDKANAKIDELEEYWHARINEAEGPAAIITSGEKLEDIDGYPQNDGVFDKAEQELLSESSPMYAMTDKVNELEDEKFEVIFAEDFTVEGEAPAIDARAFVEQFKDRKLADFEVGVTYPGQTDDDEYDNVPQSSVPNFVSVRDPQGPYVISIDEFMDPESDPPFTKVEMRWFKGDNVIVDSRDDQVPMSTIGQKNTLRFGEGTTDPSQVYIRNERLSIDIELTLEEGLYLHEVLGQDYPDKTPVLKMRQGDDG